MVREVSGKAQKKANEGKIAVAVLMCLLLLLHFIGSQCLTRNSAAVCSLGLCRRRRVYAAAAVVLLQQS